jgi:hypothetical protein
MIGPFGRLAQVGLELAERHLDRVQVGRMRLRDLIEKHLAEDARAAALNWLEKRSLTYEAVCISSLNVVSSGRCSTSRTALCRQSGLLQ